MNLMLLPLGGDRACSKFNPGILPGDNNKN